MDETDKFSQICPQPNNDQTESIDPTPYDNFMVLEDTGNQARLRIGQLDTKRGKVTSVGQIQYLDCPSVVYFCAGFIFCLGDWDWSGLVHEFDCVKRTFRTPTRLVEPVGWNAIAASGHEVIVSCGQNENEQTVATCSVYAPATNRWMSLRKLRQARWAHRMCWLPDGRVFAIGGFHDDVGYLSSVEMLERSWISASTEEALAEWRNVAFMKTGRHDFGCCVVEGRIVVAGGKTAHETPSLSVESFEPPTATRTGQWTSLTDLASPAGWCFLTPSTDGLLLIDRDGGMHIGKRTAKVASLGWQTWTWKFRPRLTSFKFCWGLVSLPSTSKMKTGLDRVNSCHFI